ncbi:MAG: hypothetical protein AB7L41_12050 [Flavobacteriaceae bacterium]
MAEASRSISAARRWLRRILLFMLAVLASQVVGKWVESAADPQKLADARTWQQELYISTASLAPLALASNYFLDLLYFATQYPKDASVPIGPSAGEIESMELAAARTRAAYSTAKCDEPPPEPPKPEPAAEDNTLKPMDLDAECRMLRQSTYCDISNLEEYAKCTTRARPAQERYDSLCKGWEEAQNEAIRRQREITRQQMEMPPPPDPGRGRIGVIMMSPALALARAWNRLTYPGGWSYVWAALQLGAGLAGYFLIRAYNARGSREPVLPRDFWGWGVGMPIATVAIASLVALVVKYLMLAGLLAFGWFTCFAAAAAGGVGFAAICWFFGVELLKQLAQNAVAPPKA